LALRRLFVDSICVSFYLFYLIVFYQCCSQLISSFFPYTTLFRSSRGFLGGYPYSRHTVSVAPIAGRGANMQRDYWYSSHRDPRRDRKSTRLNSSHVKISYAVFCLKKKMSKFNYYSKITFLTRL